MKKETIYKVGLFYVTKIRDVDFVPSVVRLFRDSFKSIFEAGMQIEKDLTDLRAKYKDEAEKLQAEIKTLMEETVEVTRLPKSILEQFELVGLKIKTEDLTLLESVME